MSAARGPGPQPPGFSGPVVLRQTGDVDWTLVEPLTQVTLDGFAWSVPADTPTDGASVPRVVSWLVPRSGRYLPAAVVHDRAYRVWIPAGRQSYQGADRVLLEGMRLLGVSFLVRWLIFSAVRMAGLVRGPAGRAGWWRDAPRVLPCVVLAAPVVVPPAALVAVALAVMWLAELVMFAGLLAFGRADRYVNRPSDTVTTRT